MPHLRDLHRRILEILAAHPEGIAIGAIRADLGLKATEQQHLDRRLRDLDARYVIERVREGGALLYVLVGERAIPLDDSGISKSLRAQVLHLAGGRCQMCGRTVIEDRARLHMDHRIPRDWGGKTELDNLWAICSLCNEGKKAFFATITDSRVKDALAHPSIHVRLGELMKAFGDSLVPKEMVELVARSHADWERRLRELRVLGWRYEVTRRKEGGRVRTYYRLRQWRSWPPNPAAAVRAAERQGRAS